MLDQTQDQIQVEFDNIYITSSELMKNLNISRTSLMYARRNGKLPLPIVLNNGQLLLWKRNEITPYLEIWRNTLKLRRGV